MQDGRVPLRELAGAVVGEGEGARLRLAGEGDPRDVDRLPAELERGGERAVAGQHEAGLGDDQRPCLAEGLEAGLDRVEVAAVVEPRVGGVRREVGGLDPLDLQGGAHSGTTSPPSTAPAEAAGRAAVGAAGRASRGPGSPASGAGPAPASAHSKPKASIGIPAAERSPTWSASVSVVPGGELGGAVVGDRVGAAAVRVVPGQPQDLGLGPAQGPHRRERAVAGEDRAGAGRQERAHLAEALEAGLDRREVVAAVDAGVAGVRRELVERDGLDLGPGGGHSISSK